MISRDRPYGMLSEALDYRGQVLEDKSAPTEPATRTIVAAVLTLTGSERAAYRTWMQRWTEYSGLIITSLEHERRSAKEFAKSDDAESLRLKRGSAHPARTSVARRRTSAGDRDRREWPLKATLRIWARLTIRRPRAKACSPARLLFSRRCVVRLRAHLLTKDGTIRFSFSGQPKRRDFLLLRSVRHSSKRF